MFYETQSQCWQRKHVDNHELPSHQSRGYVMEARVLRKRFNNANIKPCGGRVASRVSHMVQRRENGPASLPASPISLKPTRTTMSDSRSFQHQTPPNTTISLRYAEKQCIFSIRPITGTKTEQRRYLFEP